VGLQAEECVIPSRTAQFELFASEPKLPERDKNSTFQPMKITAFNGKLTFSLKKANRG
jgi:hypothetical protein